MGSEHCITGNLNRCWAMEFYDNHEAYYSHHNTALNAN